MTIGSDVLVVDIETIPDMELAHPTELYDGDGQEKFAAPPFHKIVAIAFAHALVSTENQSERVRFIECRTGGNEAASEGDLLRGFWSFLAKLQPTVVTWNGRAFDIPVLLWRSMRWHIAAPAWFRKVNHFENYNYRFNFLWHADLMDIMSGYGATRPVSLDAAARTVGAPGKLGVEGSDVREMIAAGRLAEVQAYCETDVLSTFLVWLGWRHLTGELSDNALQEAHDGLAVWLDQEQTLRPHLAVFRAAWR